MENSNVVVLVSVWRDKIPSESVMMVQQSLEKVPDENSGSLGMIALKNPIIGLILGIFFGYLGVDRFYKGDIFLGLAKLFTCIVGFVTIFILIGYFILFVLVIWEFIDYFLVWMGIKKDNLNKIMQAIQLIK